MKSNAALARGNSTANSPSRGCTRSTLLGMLRRSLAIALGCALAIGCGGKTGRDSANITRVGTGGDGASAGSPSAGGVPSGGRADSGGSGNGTGGGAGQVVTGGSGATAPLGGSAGEGAVGGSGPDPISEEDLALCNESFECVVVPYSHCCGATKRAINSSYLDEYAQHPEWQVFDDPSVCAVIGICAPDEDVEHAICDAGLCRLVYPASCAPLACDLACPAGYWQGLDGCDVCACSPPEDELDNWLGGSMEHVSTSASASTFVGGIDRTTIDITIRYDDPVVEDEEHTANISIQLMHVQWPYFAEPTTYFFDDPAIESVVVTHYYSWFEPEAVTPASDSFVTIRPVGDNLEGGVYIVGGGLRASGRFGILNPWVADS